MEAAKNKEYLGDGLYARHDGFGVWLTSENGVRVLNEVYLEPDVYEALKRYMEGVKRGESHDQADDGCQASGA